MKGGSWASSPLQKLDWELVADWARLSGNGRNLRASPCDGTTSVKANHARLVIAERAHAGRLEHRWNGGYFEAVINAFDRKSSAGGKLIAALGHVGGQSGPCLVSACAPSLI
jgi:hypothetical protein